ncbi:hypothetical protein LTR36_004234 [Oleoguttula mirabilis]|uniref:tRNA nucleotidyltransferase n=1 Tax=Oleoguttula mirabilis TaxID=1507867 RepID=A0AAV9JH94_9PEZI|nr:hypothetical protein LTR36_004234 [Oleoguttula mirabilis]
MAPALIQEVEDDAGPPKTLELSAVEATLCRLLLNVAKHVDESPPSTEIESQVALPDELAKQPIVLRFTGGWVRDKLLGVPSHDIDVAINKMTGYQYGLRLKEYLEIPGNLAKYGLEDIASNDKQSQKAGATDKSKTVGGLHKIEANPEKSKHLETTTMRILGLDIDLVNLRKETYSDDSRNPQIEFGTPEEDALRRDATVNAMFYNVNTEEIEDFTGRGHDDMHDKLIRTPLEPYQTFKDDPLRVLRLIRFASRLDYTIDQKALVAMRDRDIKDALRRKISRERVGIEVDKFLHGPDPHEALRLVFDLDLYETIFCDPTVESSELYRPDTEGWQTIIDQLRDILDEERPLAEGLVREPEERYLAWQLAALVAYRDAPEPEPSAPGRRAPPPVAVTIAREGIKATNKVSDVILAAVRNQSEISSFVDKLSERKRRPDKVIEGEDPMSRDVLGMAVRRWGASWRSQVMYSFLVDVAESQGSVEATERRYTAFLAHIRELDLLEVNTLKPLLDGKTLAKALGTPPGPWMKDALDIVMAWQLRHPGATSPAEAIEEVKAKRAGELTSSLARHFLKLTIRPLFLKAKPSNVTDAGRKVTTTVLPQKMTASSMDDTVNKPWKGSKEAFALDLLRWVVQALDAKLLEEVWPMVVPPVLTLLDDWETQYKCLGAELLRQVLEATPPLLLVRTGLGEVFEEALLPCLTFLPTITPEDESIELLSAVYPALLSLSRTRYPMTPSPSSRSTATELNRQRIKFLDLIVRKGILYGYQHCSQYPRITSVLFAQLTPLLNELGVECVKHLKYILPTLTETLAHPLAVEQTTATLLSAVQALQALILNAWPRIPEYRGVVLKGLTLCWLNLSQVDQAGGEEVEALRAELKIAVEMLRAVLGPDAGFDEECATLITADSRLEGLLASHQTNMTP